MRVVILLSFFVCGLSFALPPIPSKKVYEDPYWRDYFAAADKAIEVDFWHTLDIFQKSESFNDPYVLQLKEMGYVFTGKKNVPPFLNSLAWICRELDALVASGVVDESDVLWPGKAFLLEGRYLFVAIGEKVPKGAQPLNLLTPDAFVAMLAAGFFPVSEPIRANTNQTLAQHDLAHLAGFVSNPSYMAAVREAFRRVGVKMQTNPRVANALKEFDSLYSLRLYYMVEVFTEVPEHSRTELQRLIELPLDKVHTREDIIRFLRAKANNPVVLAKFLAELYERVHALVNPLGGESRDILNRRRKNDRDAGLGGFYDGVSALSSKFYGNSFYSLYLNARRNLENKRPEHSDFDRSLVEIHAPVIGALLGTCKLSVGDWVLECVEEVPRKDSNLYKYINGCGFFNRGNALHWAYCEEEYDKVLKAEEMK